jgi:formamidopyrimidine-DNA glycosylase
MPELPEVETVRDGLEKLFGRGAVIASVRLMRPDIRFVIPRDLPAKLAHQPILGVRRRAKYLLVETANGTLLCHLGMTGTWRLAPPGGEDKHDHCYIELADGRRLAFRDPRRFGMLDWIARGEEDRHPRLKDLGPEPLDEQGWSADYLHRVSRGRRVAIKVFIMNQKYLVGVGNIYASEALFRARIRPAKHAGKLTRAECERLTPAVRDVLREAIAAGGSSISDFKGAGGAEGYFQKTFRVYDRAGEPCAVCGTPIKSKVLGGRSTFWCPKCQT